MAFKYFRGKDKEHVNAEFLTRVRIERRRSQNVAERCCSRSFILDKDSHTSFHCEILNVVDLRRDR